MGKIDYEEEQLNNVKTVNLSLPLCLVHVFVCVDGKIDYEEE